MHTDTSLLAPPLFPQTVTPATPQCHPRIQTEISSTHWSVLRTLLLPPRSQIEKRLCAFVRHPVDSQAVAFSDCTPVGFLKASNVQRLSENVPPKGLHGRFPNPGRTGCFQPPPERIPYVPPARASDNVCGKRHAADCGPSRSSPAAVNPAVVPEDGPMSSPHRSGITDAQATDCKSASTEDGGPFRTDCSGLKIITGTRGGLVRNEIHLLHHPVIERHGISAVATDGRKMVPPDAPAPLTLRHTAGKRS